MMMKNISKRDAVVGAAELCAEITTGAFKRLESDVAESREPYLHVNYADALRLVNGFDEVDIATLVQIVSSDHHGRSQSGKGLPKQQVDTLSDEMSVIFRSPEYGYSGVKEDDAVHSVLLARQLYEIVASYAGLMPTGINVGRLLCNAIVHDLDEVITGDVRTLKLSAEQLTLKSASSAIGSEEFYKKYGHLPRIVRRLRAYNMQQELEAQIVKIHDKACPALTHAVNKGKVLRAEYDIHSPADYMLSAEGTSRKIFLPPYSNHPFWLAILCESRARAMSVSFEIGMGQARVISLDYAKRFGLCIDDSWLVK